MQVQEIKSSLWKSALTLIGSLALTVLCAALSSSGNFIIWFGVAFFGLGSIISVFMLVRPQRLLLTPSGFSVVGGLSRSPKETLWSEVSPFFVFDLPKGGKMIGFNYTSEAQKNSILVRLSQSIGADGGLPTGWTQSPEKIVVHLNSYRAKVLAKNAAIEG